MKRLTILPTRLSNGKWIWFSWFIKKQEYKDNYECISDLGWPDEGEWGYVKRWITINKFKTVKK